MGRLPAFELLARGVERIPLAAKYIFDALLERHDIVMIVLAR